MTAESTRRRGEGDIIDRLLSSEDPSVRFALRTRVLGQPEDDPGIRALRASIADSERARALLSGWRTMARAAGGPYRKWQGSHWTLWQLARLDYPPGDPALFAPRDEIHDWLLSAAHLEYPHSLLVPGQEDRFRHCASIEGNAIWYSIRLGVADEGTRELAARLVRWQWPDGGWNCDKRPEARTSSVTETLIPLRGLVAAARAWGDAGVAGAADRAAEYFLARGLFRRLRDGAPIRPSWGGPFELINHPIVFYDLLSVLVVMKEAGRLGDPRCEEALDLLEAKRLPDGGFPAEFRTAKTAKAIASRGSFADWGAFGARRSNELVTVEALGVLVAAGRCDEALLARAHGNSRPKRRAKG